MKKTASLLIIIFLMSAATPSAESAARDLLRDGHVLKGVEGQLIGSDSNDVWLFEFGSDVNDVDVVVPAGTRLEILPSSTLEKIIVDANDHTDRSYRLWARVTAYKDKNYMLPMYFVRIIKEKEPDSDTSLETGEEGTTAETTERQEPAISEPNDILPIPQEILDKLEARRAESPLRGRSTVDGNSIAGGGKLQNTDFVLVDRTGRLVEDEEGKLEFVLDAFGRNVSSGAGRFEILPCEALELVRRMMSSIPEEVRFKISGIITKYEGKNYLLLSKATRIYSHGNFAR